MYIEKIAIHNFRSIKDIEIKLVDYSVLVGENNSGKTSILTALRVFYENEGAKFNKNIDFPKFPTDDNESWIEIEFKTTLEEQTGLKHEYKDTNNLLRVRRYFQSKDKNLVKPNQSNIYAYENGILSKNLFYGAKNISQAKLGNVIYIPEVSKTDESLKLSGPSPFRDILNFLFSKLVKSSESFDNLGAAFDIFNEKFSIEESLEGYSLNQLKEDINNEIEEWEINFGFRINPIQPNDIIKNLVSHYVEDKNLKNKEVSLNAFGQGFQRHFIYSIIKVSTKYVDKKTDKKKDFNPDFTLILFEEPEAFLHPLQQESLNTNLRLISSKEEQQIFATTHSPVFVGKNFDIFKSIIRVKKTNGRTSTFQLNDDDFNKVINENYSLYKHFQDIYESDETDKSTKKAIIDRRLAGDEIDSSIKLEEEALKYFMWLDSERAALFFARKIIICEGASEKIFIDFLVNNKWPDIQKKKIYFLDSMGKYNIHRYMNLFGVLGIEHSILMDTDKDKVIHSIINNFLDLNKNNYTQNIYLFNEDFEKFLSIDKPKNHRNDLKPINVFRCYQNGNINGSKINELKNIVNRLI